MNNVELVVRAFASRLKAYFATPPGVGLSGLGWNGYGGAMGSGGWFPIFGVREPFSGAWQRNIYYDQDTILRFFVEVAR